MCEEGSLQEMRRKAHVLCKEYLNGSWSDITADRMIFRQVSGGLSNLLYYCGLPDGVTAKGQEPDRLLLRLYGRANEANAMEALVTESVIFTLLSESQRGPRLYGVFPGGRLEQYIPARALVTRELTEPATSAAIAEKMALIHQMDVPINKSPKWLWKTMDSWLQSIGQVEKNDLSPEQRRLFEQIDSMDLNKELIWLKDYLQSVESPVVFCHNDLQEGNILLLDEPPTSDGHAHTSANSMDTSREDGAQAKPRIIVIDYEYCSYNYRGFDIANHFCEWVYDYSNERPPYFYEHFENISSNKQEHFLRRYLRSLSECSGYVPSNRDSIECLREEADVFALASHFFWALWSVANSTTSTITFDYSVQDNVCICTMEFAPVCGTDGVTYPNMCNLKCQQKNNNGLALAHGGECGVQEDVCICTMECAPVCGSDGVTYPNKCNLQCKQKNNNGLKLEHSGACDM